MGTKVRWRYYFVTKDGAKVYVKIYVTKGQHHHTLLKKEAMNVTTDQAHKLDKLLGKLYKRERVLKSEL